MKQIKRINAKFGYIDIFTNKNKTILYVIPNGYVGPALVKKDMAYALQFDTACTKKWTYIVNTSQVKIINPANPFLLKRLMKFKNRKEYIVYAPNPMVRIGLRLTNWILKAVGKLQDLTILSLINNPISKQERERIRRLLPNCILSFGDKR